MVTLEQVREVMQIEIEDWDDGCLYYVYFNDNSYNVEKIRPRHIVCDKENKYQILRYNKQEGCKLYDLEEVYLTQEEAYTACLDKNIKHTKHMIDINSLLKSYDVNTVFVEISNEDIYTKNCKIVKFYNKNIGIDNYTEYYLCPKKSIKDLINAYIYHVKIVKNIEINTVIFDTTGIGLSYKDAFKKEKNDIKLISVTKLKSGYELVDR